MTWARVALQIPINSDRFLVPQRIVSNHRAEFQPVSHCHYREMIYCMTEPDPLVTREILDALDEGLYVVDLERRITFWNKGAEKITGYSAQEVVGKNCGEKILMHVDDAGTSLCETVCALSHTLSDGKFREQEVFLKHKDGYRLPVIIRVGVLRGSDGQVKGAVEVFADNSSRLAERHRLKELEAMAMMDNLTKLSNRNYLEELLSSNMAEFRRAGRKFGLLFMDMDNFKWINDTFGHSVGDIVLKTAATTLRNVSRPYDVVGRWGGDEFLVLVHDVSTDELSMVAERYRALLGSTSVKHLEQEISLSLSIGGTICRHEDTGETMLARADKNMYLAKESDGKKVVIR